MAELTKGCLVRSLAGRDKGALYIITGMDGRLLLLADGRRHPIGRPKRKNIKHLQPIRAGLTLHAMKVNDEIIAAFIRSWQKQEGKKICQKQT